jgi:hypothetical protein
MFELAVYVMILGIWTLLACVGVMIYEWFVELYNKYGVVLLMKTILYFKIHKFYKSFHFVVGDNHITNIFKMTANNVYDVLFDINEVLDGYYAFDTEEDEWTMWLKTLKHQISKFCCKIGVI